MQVAAGCWMLNRNGPTEIEPVRVDPVVLARTEYPTAPVPEPLPPPGVTTVIHSVLVTACQLQAVRTSKDPAPPPAPTTAEVGLMVNVQLAAA